ncbi:MAG: phospholipase [Bacteroidota bacterium]
MIQTHSTPVQRTAHYYTIGQAGPHIKKLWLVCHGYGQLASSFLQDFEKMAGPDTLVIAPEGLSRFYWGGFTGPVVSSWMTSKDRLEEIADYTRFLRRLYDEYVPLIDPAAEINFLGFSQGCATQVRWLIREHPHFHRLILWSGFIPEDIDYAPHLDYLADKRLHFVYGIHDRFLTDERLQMHRDLIRDQKLKVDHHTFEGGHRIDQDLLLEMAHTSAH